MAERLCVLCDQPAGGDARSFSITPEAQALVAAQFPGADSDPLIGQGVICAQCAALPATERQALATAAIMRQLKAYHDEHFSDRFSLRVDLARSLDTVPLSDETWDWINLIGHAVTCTQYQASTHDTNSEWFSRYDDYKWILVAMVAKDINTLGAIYMALRGEWTHQAAALLRTLCESLITLRFIAQDKGSRSKQFLGYAVIDEYETADRLLQWDAEGARPEAVERLKTFRENRRPQYDEARAHYKAKRNWSGKTIAQMARETSSDRLYSALYGQTSAYIHGSAWSLRAVGAFTRRGYDARRVLRDISALVRLTLAVWFEWAAFCDNELGWNLSVSARLDLIKHRLEELQMALDVAERSE